MKGARCRRDIRREMRVAKVISEQQSMHFSQARLFYMTAD